MADCKQEGGAHPGVKIEAGVVWGGYEHRIATIAHHIEHVGQHGSAAGSYTDVCRVHSDALRTKKNESGL